MNYFEERDFVIKNAKLNYKSHKFDGHGFMEWSPEKGFELKLFVESDSYKQPQSEMYGDFKIIKENERSNIHLFLDFYRKAIIPSAYLPSRLSFDIDRTLQFKSHRLVLFQESFYPDENYWTGRALYRISEGGHNFPETLNKSETLNETTTISSGTKPHGVTFQNEIVDIKGWKTNDEYFNLLFKLSKKNYTQEFALKFPCGFQTALSFILGENVQRLKSEVDTKHSTILEVFKKFEVKRMKNYQTLKTFDQFTGKLLGKLALFLTKGFLDHEKFVESYVSKLIISQLKEAESQQSIAAQELLTATILEAALRTLYRVPFLEKQKSQFAVDHYLKNQFIPQYADGKRWRETRKTVIKAFERMRHRNAHPDWLVKDDSIYSDNRISDTYLDLRIMIKFYQQMILLMAGIENIETELPKKI